ncbi:uncharacterized protein MELLADRAFT_117760 [Melampsora larici-populina 98AG31]|uniref:Uncharacterized protein n=1 Tax=Melampsora larici-populina (strain 98AG31 / pathotype 3-4-7) TaxID=747676 RepID=F4S193_MELLP|nr:uncharacterized protein MELLADRAFT_117760 [Melampsora larici-populina 98AG31]EGG01603.1 hypothetical protein MELLADRAFT_117760 [Melampsora larici-populina 98AG31]
MSTGTTQQTWINKQRNRKNALLKKKFSTYHRHVSKYNSSHRRRDALADLTFEDIESMPVTHGFWDLGGLSHPEEQWASNDDTKEGIRIYLVWRAANEELLHIARETRQLIRWALEFQVKLDDIRREYLSTDDHAKADRMKFLYITLVKKTSRLWMMWDVELKDVLDWSAPYFDGALDMDPQMYDHWRMMKARSMNHWAELVDMPHLFANETNGVLLTTNAN